MEYFLLNPSYALLVIRYLYKRFKIFVCTRTSAFKTPNTYSQ